MRQWKRRTARLLDQTRTGARVRRAYRSSETVFFSLSLSLRDRRHEVPRHLSGRLCIHKPYVSQPEAVRLAMDALFSGRGA